MDEFFEKCKKLFGIESNAASAQQTAALETGLYTICAASIGMFSRWMQQMLAFNELGLPDPSFWNWGIIVIAVFAAWILNHRIDKMKNRRWFLPKNYTEVYATDSKVLLSVSVLGALIIAAGAVLLITECQKEKTPAFFIATAILGILAAISMVTVLFSARSGAIRLKFLRLISVVPMLFFSCWLICTYQANSINPVVMAFGLQIISICFLMMTAFRLGGIFFYSFKPSRTMFLCMFSTYLCAMNIADSIYFGEILMFIGVAVILVCYNWIMISNMQERDTPDEFAIKDGFDRL